MSGETAEAEKVDNVNVRLPVDVREVIARQAKAEHRTISGQIRYLIACGIEAQAEQTMGNRR